MSKNIVLNRKGLEATLVRAVSSPHHVVKFTVSVDSSSLSAFTDDMGEKVTFDHPLGLVPPTPENQDPNGAVYNVRVVINKMRDFFISAAKAYRFKQKLVVPVLDEEGYHAVNSTGVPQYQWAVKKQVRITPPMDIIDDEPTEPAIRKKTTATA